VEFVVIDKFLRVPKESVLNPLATHVLHPFHPTAITVVAAGIGVIAAVAAWQQWYLLALGLWLTNRVLDGLDGTVARINQKQSDLGGYLDIVLDMLVYAAIPLGLAIGVNSIPVYISLGFLFGAFYINGASWMYLAALLEKRKHGAAAQGEMTTVTMPGGLIEGTETIIFFCLFLLFPGWLVELYAAMAVLVLFTTGQRIVWAVHNLK
jgi:phosphatidylglycerophosphate synthase